jgi:hypothetical protein
MQQNSSTTDDFTLTFAPMLNKIVADLNTVHVRIYSTIYHVIIDVVITVRITNPNSNYTLSAFKENTHLHYKKVR